MGSTSSKPVARKTDAADEKSQMIASFKTLSVVDNNTAEPLSTSGNLTLGNFNTWERTASKHPGLALARTILAHSDPRATLVKRKAQVADTFVFNHSVHFEPGPRTNQKSSGRCWLFATTNVLRYEVMKKLRLEEFQLSQSYLFFWDKLEKANYYLELTIENAHLPIDDRLIRHLAQGPLGDGGQWDMACNLLEKYGLVPQSIYPESFSSSASGGINTLLTTELREHALKLRRLNSELTSAGTSTEEKIASLRATKETLMASIWTTMTTAMGVPPRPDESFTWEYYDKHDRFGKFEGTPRDFFKTFSNKLYPPTESFSLIHDPRNEPSALYTVDKLGNIWGARPVLYVNTEIDRLKQAVITSIKAGQPVFFGCDVGKDSDRVGGIMDTELYDFKSAYPLSLGLTKAERLQTGESAMTHAMVISAVHLDESGKPVRYKVENSWGTDVGDKGWFVMTDKWFEQYVYQVVIPNSLAPKDLLDIFNGEKKTVLPPWDPMGSLA